MVEVSEENSYFLKLFINPSVYAQLRQSFGIFEILACCCFSDMHTKHTINKFKNIFFLDFDFQIISQLIRH